MAGLVRPRAVKTGLRRISDVMVVAEFYVTAVIPKSVPHPAVCLTQYGMCLLESQKGL